MLDDLRTGSATIKHTQSLQAQINETLKFFELEIAGQNRIEDADEYLRTCIAAREALLMAIVRANGSSNFTATSEEIERLRDFAHLRVDLMRSEVFTVGDSLAAQREVLNCFRRGHFDHVRSPDFSAQGGAAHA